MNIGSSRQLAGENWGRYIDTSDGLSFGNWQSIVAVSASTINIAASNTSGNTSSVSLLAGQEIRGRFTSLTVVSGAVICRSSVWQKGPGGIYTSPSQFSYDDYVDWSIFGTNNIVPNGTTFSSNLGKSLTITNNVPGFSTSTLVQGSTWLGNFQNNEVLLFSFGNELVTISFSAPVRGVGFQLQSSRLGINASYLIFKDSSNNPIASDLSYGISSVLTPSNPPQFTGYQSSTANISKVEIRIRDSSSLSRFAFNRLLIKT